MNVLHVTPGLVYGGVERFLETLVEHRHADPRTTHEFVVTGGRTLAERLVARGAVVHDIGRVRRRLPWTVATGRRRLAAIVRERNTERVVMHSGWPLGLLGVPSSVADRPIVLWQHGGANSDHWVDRLAARRRPSHVVGNSRWTLDTLGDSWPGTPRVLVRYPVASSGTKHAPNDRIDVRREFRTPANDVVLMIAARMESWKGHTLLLDALARLVAEGLGGWTAWIVGGSQSRAEARYEASLRYAATELGLDEHLRWAGQRDDVPRLLAAADVHCQPNTGPEPFGIAFVEALAVGLPVVTTALGGPLEFIDDSVGALVEPGNARALAAALRTAIVDLLWRAERSANGPARARVLCDPEARVAEIGAVLRGREVAAA